jgi:hypothetical protein
MKKLFLCAALLIMASLSAQEGGKDFTCKPLKWTIKVPVGYEKAEIDNDALIEGEEAIFSVINATEDTMEATLSPYNEEEDGEYGSMQEMTATLMKAILQKSVEEAGGEMELTTQKETISGKEFYHHEYIMIFDGETSVMHLFNTLIDGKDFCMDISYTDAAEGQKMLKAFRESKFK